MSKLSKMSQDSSSQKMMDHSYCLSKFLVVNKDFTFKLPKKTTMSEMLTKRIIRKEKPDVVFVIGKMYYGCHAIVMRYYSELCAHFLPPGTIVSLPIDKVTNAAFILIYDWMLKEESHCPRGQLLDLLQGAHFFYMPQLMTSLFGCLNGTRSYSEVDAIHIYFEAKSKKRWGIAELMLRHVRKYFLLLVATDEFREMDLRCLLTLLTSDCLAVQSEIEVFYAAMYWMYFDYDSRKKHLAQLLDTVRFVLFSPSFLWYLSAHLHELAPRIADELYPMVHLAMLQKQEIHMGAYEDEEINVRDRVWISDPDCPYAASHKRKMHFVTHVDFLNYLDKLENAPKFLARIKEVGEKGFEKLG